ncbi:hypothetical protein Hanom_Chr04g00286331 [Helianthus anomalus]
MKPEDALKLSEYPHLCSICVLLKQFAASAFIYQTLSIPYEEPIGLEYEPTKKQKPRKTSVFREQDSQPNLGRSMFFV